MLYKKQFRLAIKQHSRSLASLTSVTFENQDKLSRLPIPTLESSIVKYLSCVKPLLNPQEYSNTQRIAQDFSLNSGKELQERLIAYDREQKFSWLENIWLNRAYLGYRAPLPVNSNWWCMFDDIKTLDRRLVARPPPKGVLTSSQVERASKLVNYFLDFKEMIDRQVLEPEFLKGTPLCMNQYKNLFSVHRTPAPTTDKLEFPQGSKHIILLIRNQIYKINVIHADGSRASNEEIQRLIYAAGQNSLESSADAPVGYLTAGNRDRWAEAYNILSQDEKNKTNLNEITNSLFVLCLDDHSMMKKVKWAHWQFFKEPENRWFDKALQLIVTSSGRAGVNGEHTPSDAVVAGRLFDTVVHWEKTEKPLKFVGDDPMEQPQRLNWNVNETITKMISEAKEEAQGIKNSTNSIVVDFDSFGSRYIKEIAKQSPDSFVQMALLTTFYRLYNAPTAIYETASTRKFLHGRTETGRVLNDFSLEFLQKFDSDDFKYSEKTKAFVKAATAHSDYMKIAMNGMGFDRHFLALNSMKNSKEASEFFNDPAFSKVSEFKISTSNMSSATNIKGGFGPVHPNGYGICYQIQKDCISLSISHKKETESRLRQFIVQFERTMRDFTLLFPRRSDIWGTKWHKDVSRDKKEEYYLQKMKEWSDKQLGRNW